uniref:Uncharacterized protein n=1 Tax=Lutzomyia ayacuchensis TaxID=252632 RepID=L0MZU0_LUTAY|nr:hypothetical protein [Lutzomyia ayacuchensis]
MMKYQCFVLIAIFFWIGQSRAEHPERKCIRELARTDEVCILRCSYSYYGFTDENYRITKKHIETFRDVLISYNAVPGNEKNKLFDHIKACADTANATKPKSHNDKCYKIIHYYRCVVDGKVLSWNSYAAAIIKYDKTKDA